MTSAIVPTGPRARVAVGAALLAFAIVAFPLVGASARGRAPLASPTSVPTALAVVMPAANCAALSKLDLAPIGGAGSRVSAAAEATGTAGEPVCAVEGTLAPAVAFRVELPLRGWTQRYLQTGCGGLCGSLRIEVGAADGCPEVRAGGFAVASTDMGHKGMGGEFGLDARKRADFAYRGVHLTSVAAKALIRAFYGRSARFSYFDGCSDGGREALVEAERFPSDFDGIVAGAPALNFTVQNSLYHGWQARSNTGADGRAILVAARLPILHAAVLRACDAIDGQVDGLVSMPGRCRFDPMAIACRAGQDRSTCLTPAEADVARRFYDGPRDPRSGDRLTQGGPQFGSELQWAGVYVPMSADQPIFSTIIADGAMPNLIFGDGHPATVRELSFDRATFDSVRARHALFDASSPDLSAFVARGGKLILYHGWADPHISPLNTIAFHDALRRFFGAAKADGFERLYLMPGMGHCGGGEGPSAFDLLTPAMAWVESGVAPDAIMTRTPPPGRPRPLAGPRQGGSGRPGAGPAARDMRPPIAMPPMAAGPARSRPVYPYPYVATFVGTGDANAAAGWTKGPAMPVEVPAWVGSDYYEPYVGATG